MQRWIILRFVYDTSKTNRFLPDIRPIRERTTLSVEMNKITASFQPRFTVESPVVSLRFLLHFTLMDFEFLMVCRIYIKGGGKVNPQPICFSILLLQ